MKKLKIWSLLKIVNVFILQWVCIRLAKCSEKVVDKFNVHSFDFISNGTMGLHGTGTTKKYTWFSIMYWVKPLSGWTNDFKYINSNESKLKQITKKKVENL